MIYKICSRCIMDTSDPNIIIDAKDICNHCKDAIVRLNKMKVNRSDLKSIVSGIRKAGVGRKYDCVIGMSGGVDSSYVAIMVKRLGLRPIAVHLDNGWDTEAASQNINTLAKLLDIDLITYKVDWESFRDLQLSFLKSGTPDLDIPTDHAIGALLKIFAHKYNVKYIIDGANLSSETILPTAWSHGHHDWRYIKSIHKQFGEKKLKSFLHLTLLDTYYFRKIESISILNYINYDKEKAKQFLVDKYHWIDYGGKHHESIFTKFYQTYILPVRFGIEKRRSHYSSLIVAGQMTREEALQNMKEPSYDENELESDITYVTNKLGISRSEFNECLKQPIKSYMDYDNYEKSWLYKILKAFGLYVMKEYK